jgi:transcriptional regulator with PAS, ATPase and Fis domain
MTPEPRARILCAGPLGLVVAAALERSVPRWRIVQNQSDLTVADDLPREPIEGPILVLGRDVEVPFTVGQLRQAALAKLEDRSRDPIVAIDPPLKDALAMIDRIAVNDAPLLITGESGTGKELAAREVHRRSKRQDGPFVPCRFGGVPDGLLDRELFGEAPTAASFGQTPRGGLFPGGN